MSEIPTESGGDVCQSCGACCAFYRVTFYWAEALQRALPDEWTEKRDHHTSCMRGTNQANPRCVALSGTIGQHVSCQVYDQRPSPCRAVMPGSEQCRKARAAYALPAL